MLDDRNSSLQYILIHVNGELIVLQLILFRFCADRIDLRIKQVALRRCQFLYAPVIAAGIPVRNKITIRAGKIALHKLVAFEYAVFSIFKAGVTLRCPGFAVGFR